MEDAIRKAAAGFYRTRLGLEEAPDASFLDYRKLADAVIAATDVLPLNSELKTMIQKEKDLLAKNYFKSNSAIYLILNKLLEGRGVKELKNMFTSTSRFQPNAVFSFEKEKEEPEVEVSNEEGEGHVDPTQEEATKEPDPEEGGEDHEREIAEVQTKVADDNRKIQKTLETVEGTVKELPVSSTPIPLPAATIKEVVPVPPVSELHTSTPPLPVVSFDHANNEADINAILKKSPDNFTTAVGGRRTRSLLKRIRTLTKKNIRR